MTNDPVPPIIAELLGNHVDSIRGLARRTAELHAALSSRSDIPDFAPEPFTTFYRQSVYHGMLGQLNRSFELLRSRARVLPASAQDDIAEVLNREGEIRNSIAVAARQADVGKSHPQPWRLSSVERVAFRQRLGHHQLRRRSQPLVERTPHQALGTARRCDHAAVVPLCVACRVVRRRARHRSQPRCPSPTGKVGPDLVPVGQCHLPEGIPEARPRPRYFFRSKPMNLESCWAPT